MCGHMHDVHHHALHTRPKSPSLFALAFSDPIDFAPTYKYAVGTDEYDTRNDKKVRSGRRAAIQYNKIQSLLKSEGVTPHECSAVSFLYFAAAFVVAFYVSFNAYI